MILMIDADERVTPTLRNSIEQTLQTPCNHVVYSINRSNVFLGYTIKYSGWHPDRVIRLYPNHFKYNDNSVHESLNVAGFPIKKLAGNLKHLTCTDLTFFQKKQLNYAILWANSKYQNGLKCSLITVFIRTIGAFLKTLIIRAGFLDKQYGLLISIINAQYTFNKYLILWSLNKSTKKK